MKLAELERYFAAVATSTSGPPADLDEVFESRPELPATALLGIYNRGYHARLLGALASVFARTRRALGDAAFERLGLQYVARHPSEHPAVERVGRSFPQYLAEQPGCSRALGDLARLEWARLMALVAPDPSALAFAHEVDAASFPGSRLRFVPSLTIHSLARRSLELFRDPAAPPEDDASAPQRGVAVWRKGHDVKHEPIEALELEALELGLAGASVSRICALFDSGAPVEDTARAFRMLSAWFAREWIERGFGHSS